MIAMWLFVAHFDFFERKIWMKGCKLPVKCGKVRNVAVVEK